MRHAFLQYLYHHSKDADPSGELSQALLPSSDEKTEKNHTLGPTPNDQPAWIIELMNSDFAH
jgi:hypothetical protein